MTQLRIQCLALRSLSVTLPLAAACALLAGCMTQRQHGESVVFIGEEPAPLAHLPVRFKPLTVRSTYLPGQTNTAQYLQPGDFITDYSAGTLRRAPHSRLPDFCTNSLYGQEGFDHTQFPGFGNNDFFAFVDYSFAAPANWPVQQSQTQLLKSTRAKLISGQRVRIVAFGDSITAGGEASRPELIFWQRWADELQARYPKARIEAINGATGGDTTVQGLERLSTKVLKEKPDLVLIGFGMNDHNIGSVPIPQFEKNLSEMIARIRSENGAEVILFSAFPPNPKWKFGSHHMEDYAASTKQVAREVGCAYADVFTNWQAIAARKKPEDLLGNDINHPNDFGHWIYYSVLRRLGL